MCSHFVFQFLHFHELTSQISSFLFKPQLYRLTVHPQAQNIGENFGGIPDQLLGENILWIIRLFFKTLDMMDHLKTYLLSVAF